MTSNNVNIVFLGTSGSVPTRSRALPSVAIEYDGEVLLFDCGEGVQRQLMIYSVNINKINSIFITHLHGDHVIGIAGLLRTLALNNRLKPINIFIPDGYQDKINELITFDNAIIPYKINIHGIKKGVVIKEKDYVISAYPLKHSIKTMGYVFKTNDRLRFDSKKANSLGINGEMFSKIVKLGKLKVNGKIVNLSEISSEVLGKKIIYATDTRPLKSTINILKNADVLIHEATYSYDLIKLAKERMHSTAYEVGLLASDAHVKKLVLFHVSARYKDGSILLDDAKKAFKNSLVAFDGMKLNI